MWVGSQVLAACTKRGRQDYRAAARESNRSQSSHRWRLWPPARDRLRRKVRDDRDPCRWAGEGPSGRAKRTSSTTSTGRSTSTSCQRPWRTVASPVGHIASRDPRSWRAGCRPHSRRGSISTPSTVARTFPMTFQIFASSMCGMSRRGTDRFLRGVGPNNNVFAIESFMDELAQKSKRGSRCVPSGSSRQSAAISGRAEAGSGKGRLGRSIADARGARRLRLGRVCQFHRDDRGSRVDDQGEIHVRRVVSAVDTGIVINPDTVVAQAPGRPDFRFDCGVVRARSTSSTGAYSRAISTTTA